MKYAAIAVGVYGMPGVMTAAGTLAALLLLLANADRVESLRASATGIEARTRQVIDEARATLDEVRAVLKIAARANLSLAVRAGRWGPIFSFAEKEIMLRTTVATLERLKIPKAEQDEMLRDWHDVTRFDYAMAAMGASQLPQAAQSDPRLKSEWDRLHQGLKAIPTSDEVAAFMRSAKLLDNPVNAELLEDLRYYEVHRAHRRPDQWRELHDRG